MRNAPFNFKKIRNLFDNKKLPIKNLDKLFLHLKNILGAQLVDWILNTICVNQDRNVAIDFARKVMASPVGFTPLTEDQAEFVDSDDVFYQLKVPSLKIAPYIKGVALIVTEYRSVKTRCPTRLLGKKRAVYESLKSR